MARISGVERIPNDKELYSLTSYGIGLTYYISNVLKALTFEDIRVKDLTEEQNENISLQKSQKSTKLKENYEEKYH